MSHVLQDEAHPFFTVRNTTWTTNAQSNEKENLSMNSTPHQLESTSEDSTVVLIERIRRGVLTEDEGTARKGARRKPQLLTARNAVVAAAPSGASTEYRDASESVVSEIVDVL